MDVTYEEQRKIVKKLEEREDIKKLEIYKKFCNDIGPIVLPIASGITIIGALGENYKWWKLGIWFICIPVSLILFSMVCLILFLILTKEKEKRLYKYLNIVLPKVEKQKREIEAAKSFEQKKEESEKYKERQAKQIQVSKRVIWQQALYRLPLVLAGLFFLLPLISFMEEKTSLFELIRDMVTNFLVEGLHIPVSAEKGVLLECLKDFLVEQENTVMVGLKLLFLALFIIQLVVCIIKFTRGLLFGITKAGQIEKKFAKNVRISKLELNDIKMASLGRKERYVWAPIKRIIAFLFQTLSLLFFPLCFFNFLKNQTLFGGALFEVSWFLNIVPFIFIVIAFIILLMQINFNKRNEQTILDIAPRLYK